MEPTPFSSLAAFRDAFRAGLERLVASDDLGAFILSAANATFDPPLYRQLEAGLRAQMGGFERLFRGHAERLADHGAPDDVAVFSELLRLGFDGLQPTRWRNAGVWELQYNQLRAFRPKRSAGRHFSRLHVPFDDTSFNFNRPFLRKEAIWNGRLAGREVELLYNKFPFVQMHGLLVPEREHEHAQYLNEADHHYIFGLATDLDQQLPGCGFAYNSLGAYASVNHLHFQMFVRELPLPITSPQWQHNGGEETYPTGCIRLDDVNQAWRFISELHSENVAYNLVYLPGRLYVLPRKRQGEYLHSDWSEGFTWYEMAGGFTTTDQQAFSGLNEAVIAGEFARLTHVSGE